MAVVSTPERVKPKLRGVFHELGFYLALAVAPALILTTDDGRARTAAAVFAGCVAACFGASALYHRPSWRPAARARLAHFDRAGIFMLIAGTYLPFGLLVMSPDWAVPMLSLVWGGALIAIVLNLVWRHAPRLLSAAIALGLGWASAIAFPQLLKLPLPAIVLVVAGGLLYTTGAIVYMRRRPDPVPQVFGYHELFHVLTLAAVACQYASIAFFVLPHR
jgi:hemolysin III